MCIRDSTDYVSPDPEQLKNIDAVIFDTNITNWLADEYIAYSEKMSELGFVKRFESKGVQTWIRKPGSS